ncbi:unnamed protein product [Adineta ricciae]|uniref:Uncharacterized protein n=1 Tax=Adineta ricciae TaxID=249248 RepID=A0A813R4G5_ADIRI|nr:unnamed protein product [Adineta ricciae]
MCLWIINYQAGQTVHQPIVQLFGYDSIYQESVLVNGKYQWPIIEGLFKIYVELIPGENQIHLSTKMSDLSLTLFYDPLKSNENVILRLIYVTYPDDITSNIERACKQYLFLTKLVRCTFDEILHKQTACKRSLLFQVENQIHHVSMSREDFQEKTTDKDVFREIYRRIYTMDIAQDATIKLVVNSSISPSLTFASTFKNVIVLNLPEYFLHLPGSFDEFYGNVMTDKVDAFIYSIGAYLHELGHLFGLDHGNNQFSTIMSSSKDYVDNGRDFLLVTPRFSSIIFNRQCSCYKEPVINTSSTYANGLLIKQSVHLKSSCKSVVFFLGRCPLSVFNQIRPSDEANSMYMQWSIPF